MLLPTHHIHHTHRDQDQGQDKRASVLALGPVRCGRPWPQCWDERDISRWGNNPNNLWSQPSLHNATQHSATQRNATQHNTTHTPPPPPYHHLIPSLTPHLSPSHSPLIQVGATRGIVTPAARLAGLVGVVGDVCDELNLQGWKEGGWKEASGKERGGKVGGWKERGGKEDGGYSHEEEVRSLWVVRLEGLLQSGDFSGWLYLT